MNPADLFYIVWSIGMIIIVGFFIYLVYHLVETLKVVREVLTRIDSTAKDIMFVKDGVKYAALSVLARIIGSRKGGD